ncbi:hypothetical protein LTR33_007351 [Friedmanniomyces endolithicus]|nr:hypothetical protein LTR33_007351 [Friedmanniomyces endolithicus]
MAYQLDSAAVTPLTGKLFRSFSIKASSPRKFVPREAFRGWLGGMRSSSIVGNPHYGENQRGHWLFWYLNGSLDDHNRYPAWYYINLPAGAVVGVLLSRSRIPEPESKKPAREVLGTAVKSIDRPGFALISPAVIMLLLGLQFCGNEHPWNSPGFLGLIIGAAAIFVCSLFRERRQGDEAMVPFTLLNNKVIWSAAGDMAFVLTSVLVADFYLAIYFQTVNNDSPLMSGVHLLPTCLGLVLFTIISGAMKSARETSEAGRVTEDAIKSAEPVLKQCEQVSSELRDIFRTACPKDGDDRGKRIWKGAKAVFFGRDSQLLKLLGTIQDDFKLLEQKEMYVIGDKLDALLQHTRALAQDDGGK